MRFKRMANGSFADSEFDMYSSEYSSRETSGSALVPKSWSGNSDIKDIQNQNGTVESFNSTNFTKVQFMELHCLFIQCNTIWFTELGNWSYIWHFSQTWQSTTLNSCQSLFNFCSVSFPHFLIAGNIENLYYICVLYIYILCTFAMIHLVCIKQLTLSLYKATMILCFPFWIYGWIIFLWSQSCWFRLYIDRSI